MKNDKSASKDPQAMEELKEQMLGLRQEVEYLRTANQVLWSLLLDISKKGQVSLAAIKASVSSLLGYDIIWDASTQHEFLEVIDDSTDQLSKYMTLIILISKMEANDFVLNPEPVELPEVFSSVEKTITNNYPDFSISFDSFGSGKPVCADYEYLSIALVMLFELLCESQIPPQEASISLIESGEYWIVDIEKVNEYMVDVILKSTSANEASDFDVSLLSTGKLKLHLVRRVFELLSIQVSTVSDLSKPTNIRLMVPVVKSNC